MTLHVNGAEYEVGRTCSTKIDLQTPADLPLGDAVLKVDIYSDDGKLLSTQQSKIEILNAIDASQGAYAIRSSEKKNDLDASQPTLERTATT